MYYDENEDRYIMDVPTECPLCGEPLEIDTRDDKTFLVCTNNDCDYENDATDEFDEAGQNNID